MSIKNRLKLLSIVIIAISSFFMVPKTVLAAGSLTVTKITAVKTYADTDNTYPNGWSWVYDITVPTNETTLNMKFANWTSGSEGILVANNTRFYSSQSSNASDQDSAITIDSANTYSSVMNLNPASDLDAVTDGIQIQITVEFKIPVGSADGLYSTTYGVQTNLPVMSGTVSITGTAKFGQLLTVDISALTYTPETTLSVPAYQWQRNGVDIVGATAQSYTLVEADVGKVITIIVTADGTYATGNVTSGATANILKANGPSAPSDPTLSSKTSTSVILNAIALSEFSNDAGSTWQDSGTFTGLTVATEYTFTARVKETSTVNASVASSGTSITTKDIFILSYTAGTNGSITGSSPQTVDYDTNGTEVTATPATGYHFASWSDAVATAARTDINVITNKSVTANFIIDTKTLTYTAGDNGSIVGSSPQTVDYGTSGTEVTATPATGYHFASWSDAVTTAVRTDINVIANKSVTATFAINTFTLTYTAGTNSSIVGSSPQTVDYGTSGTTVTAIPDANYHFIRWSDNVMTAARTDINVTGNISVTATFAIDTHTVTFNSNGGSDVSPITGVNYNTTVTLPTDPTKTGYTFNGWFSDNSTFLVPFTASTAVLDNITVYANWNANNNTITFDGNTNDGGATVAQTLATDATANLKSNGFTKTGYTFAGWATTAEGAVVYANVASYTMGTASVTLYAKWNANNNTITFDGNTNDGGATVAQTLATDATANLTANGFTKTGYTFAGWATTAGGAVVYANVASYTMGTASVTLYAKWNAPLTTPTFSPSSGEIALGVTPITLTSDAGTTIYYTTDGSTPTTESSSIASGATITLSSVDNLIKAISVKAGYPNSAMGTSGVAIGQSYQGGKVAYIDGTGLHGLIAAVNDQSAGIIWAVTANQSTLVPNGTGTTMGTGNQNTINIVAQNDAGSTFAAGLCSNLVEGGYDDWYLPSKDELNQLYINKVAVGGFTANYYWSSSEYSTDMVELQSFNTGSEATAVKGYKAYVRAIRAFSRTYTQAATANLTGLALSDSPSNYTFAAGTYNYTGVTVFNTVSSITVTPTGSGTITVEGTTVVSGQASGAIDLTAGTEKTITIIATETGKTSKTYTIKVTKNTGVAIGQSYQGGKVAYIDGTGLHGLIAAVNDQSAGIIWAVTANQSTLVPNGTGTTMGTGNQNTINIVAQNGVDSTFAAGLCSNLDLGGYQDWYLPSKDELNQLYINKVAIGGFTTYSYWSSSGLNAPYAWTQYFGNGVPNVYLKDGTEYPFFVRAVRAF